MEELVPKPNLESAQTQAAGSDQPTAVTPRAVESVPPVATVASQAAETVGPAAPRQGAESVPAEVQQSEKSMAPSAVQQAEESVTPTTVQQGVESVAPPSVVQAEESVAPAAATQSAESVTPAAAQQGAESESDDDCVIIDTIPPDPPSPTVQRVQPVSIRIYLTLEFS